MRSKGKHENDQFENLTREHSCTTEVSSRFSLGRSITSASTNTISLPRLRGNSLAPSRPETRRKSSPQLPTGEHNAAARNRARAQSERRALRRYHRLNKTAGSDSGRSDFANQASCRLNDPTHAQHSNRESQCQSVSLLEPSPFTLYVEQEDDATQVPLTSQPKKSEMQRQTRRLPVSLTTSTTTVNLIFTCISRKPRNSSKPSMTCFSSLWNILLKDLTSSHLPISGRDHIASLPPSAEHKARPSIDSVHVILEYHPDVHGGRRYDRDSGFWSWSWLKGDA